MKTKILSVYFLILVASFLSSMGAAAYSLDILEFFTLNSTNTQKGQFIIFMVLTGGYITFKTLDYLYLKVILKSAPIN